MSFITVEELKAYPLPVNANQWAKIGDDQLSIVIGYASERIQNWLDRPMVIDRFVERYAGSGTYRLLLRQYPAATVYSVTAYSPSESSTVWDNDKFRLAEGSAILAFKDRSRYSFTQGYDWEIDYSAGFETVPGVVKHATALQAVSMLQPIFRGGTNFTEVKLIEEIDQQIVDMLDELKRRRIS